MPPGICLARHPRARLAACRTIGFCQRRGASGRLNRVCRPRRCAERRISFETTGGRPAGRTPRRRTGPPHGGTGSGEIWTTESRRPHRDQISLTKCSAADERRRPTADRQQARAHAAGYGRAWDLSGGVQEAHMGARSRRGEICARALWLPLVLGRGGSFARAREWLTQGDAKHLIPCSLTANLRDLSGRKSVLRC